MGMIKSIALATGISAVAALGAQAATVSVDYTAPTAADKAASLSLPGGGSWTSAPYVGTGTIKSTSPVAGRSVALSPYSDAVDDPTEYWFVEGRENDVGYPVNSPAVLALKSVRTAFSMLWGSPDNYNVLKFYLGGVLQAEVTGSDAPINGDHTNATTAFVSVTGLKFDSVEFYSNGKNALEFGNVAAVPVPAAGLMLLGGLGGLAALRRRKA